MQHDRSNVTRRLFEKVFNIFGSMQNISCCGQFLGCAASIASFLLNAFLWSNAPMQSSLSLSLALCLSLSLSLSLSLRKEFWTGRCCCNAMSCHALAWNSEWMNLVQCNPIMVIVVVVFFSFATGGKKTPHMHYTITSAATWK
jgi:hypothetical protein